MSNAISSVSSTLMKIAIPFCLPIPSKASNPTLAKTPLILSLSSSVAIIPQRKITITSLVNAKNQILFPGYKLLANERDPSDPGPAEGPGKTPQEFPSKVPNYQPNPVPPEIPRLPELEIHPGSPSEITTIPDPWTDNRVPPLPSPPPPPDIPLPPPGTPRPPPPNKLPPEPTPDIVPPPAPPSIHPPPTVPPDIERPGDPLGPVVT